MKVVVVALLCASALALSFLLGRKRRRLSALMRFGFAAAPVLALPPAVLAVYGHDSVADMLTWGFLNWAFLTAFVLVSWGVGGLVIAGLSLGVPAVLAHVIVIPPVVAWIAYFVTASTVGMAWEHAGTCLRPAQLIEVSEGGDLGPSPEYFCEMPPG